MDVVLIVISVLCVLVGLLGCIVPILPGPPISFIGLLLLRWSGASDFSNRFLWIWAAITVAVTVMDYWLPAWFTQKLGGSRYATVGAVVGMVAGLIFLPPVGIVLGPFLGAFFGEMMSDQNDFGKAVKVAAGSFIAFVVGTGAKLAVSGMMVYYIAKAIIF